MDDAGFKALISQLEQYAASYPANLFKGSDVSRLNQAVQLLDSRRTNFLIREK